MVALLQRTSVFHSITPFPWLFIYLILNLSAIANCAPLVSSSDQDQRWFALQNKNKEEEKAEEAGNGSEDPAGVCPTKWDFYSSSHCPAMASFQSIKVKLLDSPLSSETCTAACHPWAPQTPELDCLAHTGACPLGREEGFQLPVPTRGRVPTAHQLTEVAVP